MRNYFLLLVSVVGLVLLSSCASPSSDCVPGAQRACTCPNGAPSAQACGVDRQFGICLCDTLDGGGPVADAQVTLDGGRTRLDGSAWDATMDAGLSTDASGISDAFVAADDGSAILTDSGTSDAGATLVPGSYFAGAYHTCHLRSGGEVACWGRNVSSDVGGSASDHQNAPRVVTSLASVQTMAAGGGFSCAVLSSGSVACWGINSYHELGDGSTTTRTSAVSTSGISSAVQIDVSPLTDPDETYIAGGHHACITQSDGDVYCWGNNEYGQLGDGTTTVRTSAVSASGLGDVVSVAVGNAHSCALDDAGHVKCWGSNSEYERGTDFGIIGLSPNSVSLGDEIMQLEAGSEFTCALHVSGEIECWGRNEYSQLGHDYIGVAPGRAIPVTVDGINNATSICAGAAFACARLETGRIKCWGRNHRGQLGDGTTTTRESPVTVSVIDDATSISCGDAHACATRADHSVYCWGDDSFAQLGTGTTHSSAQTTPVLCSNE
ncbi:MAG: hypothetical protein IPK60_25605 [Sandaracinaceae bacterium]|nr:hypothetical protein [Sandaracinaceae bacterium]